MKRTALPYVLALALGPVTSLGLMGLLGGCDLKELRESERARADGGSSTSATDDQKDKDKKDDKDKAKDDPNIPPGAQLGSCDPRKWKVTASDSSPLHPAWYAVDGLVPSRWSSGAPQQAGMHFDIDFGGFVALDKVRIEPSFGKDGVDDFPRGLDVLVSYDGGDYSRRLATATFEADAGSMLSIDFPKHAAAQLRLELILGTGAWWTIHELHLGCLEAPDAGTPQPFPDTGGTALTPNGNWKATASHSYLPFDPPASAIDGNGSTRWASGKGQFGDEWFQLDLGAVTNIRQVKLATSAASDFPSAFRLSLSKDGTTFTEVVRGLGSADLKIPFPAQDARYIKIEQLGTGHDSWWGIHELTVLQ